MASNPEEVFLVICRTDSEQDGGKGDYVLATKSVFADRESADAYLASVSQTRYPHVVRLNGIHAHILRALKGIAWREKEKAREKTQLKTEDAANPVEPKTNGTV